MLFWSRFQLSSGELAAILSSWWNLHQMITLVSLPALGSNKHKNHDPGDRYHVAQENLYTRSLRINHRSWAGQWELAWPKKLSHTCPLQAPITSVYYHVTSKHNTMWEAAWLPVLSASDFCLPIPHQWGSYVLKEKTQTNKQTNNLQLAAHEGN